MSKENNKTEESKDPLFKTKLAYTERIKNEIQGIQEQMGVLQYELDIRVTALTMYEKSLASSENKKDEPDS
jgi:hypothetical protein